MIASESAALELMAPMSHNVRSKGTGIARPFGKAQPPARTDDGRAGRIAGEELVEADAEHERDPHQCGQRRHDLIAFELRQEPWRQARVTAELFETDLLLDAQAPDLRADAVFLQLLGQRTS